MKTANILVINGGGIRAVATLIQLIELERIVKTKLCNHFDYISGCSTGGIIATLLALEYSTEDILRLYTEHGEGIFDEKFLRFGIIRPKYDDTYFNNVIEQYTQSRKLSDCKTALIVPTYNASKKALKIFKSYKFSENNHTLKDVIRSTASAPTYFKPWGIEGDEYIDGGLVVNNPIMIVWIEAMKAGYEKYQIINFTTGRRERPITSNLVKAGKLGWAQPTVDILLTEMDQTTDYITRQLFTLLPSIVGRRIGMYMRCETYLSKSSSEMDDASLKNMKHLMEDGERSRDLNRDKMQTYYLNTIKNGQ